MDVLTHDDVYFGKIRDDRKSVLVEYRDNMMVYLKQCFPNTSEDALQRKLKSVIAEKIDVPIIDYIDSPEKGMFKLQSTDVLSYLNHTKDDIRSPSGATFIKPEISQSVFAGYIIGEQKSRGVFKNREVLADAEGDDAAASLFHRTQLNIKIGINAISGVMLANVAYRSSIHYNAITGAARFGTMTGYAFAERCVASNFYFASVDLAINWIVNLMRVYPSDKHIQSILDRYKLKPATNELVKQVYCDAVNAYSKFVDTSALTKLISSLSSNQLSFVFYSHSLSRIIWENPSMRHVVDDMVDINNVPEYNGDIGTTAELSDNTVFIFACTLLSEKMIMPGGGGIPLDKIDTDHPVLCKQLIALYFAIEGKLNRLTPLINTFLNIAVLPSNTIGHKNMMRKTTVLSDTDSIILTLIQWTEWYTGSTDISSKSKAMSGFIIMILSKCFAHMFTILLVRMGVPDEHMRRLSMKNEFTFTSLLRTTIAKHYASLITMREGQIMDPPRLELKGRNFVSSTLCKETLTGIKELILYVLHAPIDKYQLSFKSLITKAIEFEQKIVISVDRGETTYLETAPIKPRQEYKTPLSASFLYSLLWDIVFKGIYDPLILPQKCRVVPITELTIKNYEGKVPEVLHRGFSTFFNKFPAKKISRMFIPLELPIPPEIATLLDKEKVITFNCYALQLVMKSFNITTTKTFSYNYPQLASSVRATLTQMR